MVNFDDEWQRILVAVIMLAASIAGTFGNALVILSVLLSRKLRSPTNVFVVNLSVADLLTCLALPWNLVALLSFDGWPIADWVCSVAAAILYIPVYCSVCTLASIGVNRLIIITRPVHIYRKIFCTKVLCVWIILLWLWPFVITVLPPLTANFGALGYNERFHSCSSMSSNEYSDEYDLITAIAIYPIPLLTILVSYIGIFLHVRKQANKLKNNPNVSHVPSMTEDSMTMSPKGTQSPETPVYPISPKSAEGSIQTHKNEIQDGDHLPPLPASPVAKVLALEETNYKTNSLPPSTKRTYTRSARNLVSRTSSFPVSPPNKNEAPLRRKTGQSITQRIRSTLKQATSFTRISRRQLAITKNMFYVVVAYVLCLTPFVFCLVIDTRLSTILIPYAAALIFFNSCINPAIYATKHPYFKKIFSYLVKCQWHRVPEPSDTLRALMRKGLCRPR